MAIIRRVAGYGVCCVSVFLQTREFPARSMRAGRVLRGMVLRAALRLPLN